jgi:hypothetical protein
MAQQGGRKGACPGLLQPQGNPSQRQGLGQEEDVVPDLWLPWAF